MNVLELMKSKEGEFESALEHLKSELVSLRTGRASAALVEAIPVEAYGTTQTLRDLAQISIPEARQIFVQPWDKSVIKDVEKAIVASPLGVNPVNEGAAIRITLPALTEERRRELVKVVSQHAEAARISIRNIRESVHKELKRLEDSGEVSEDERFRGQESLQKKIEELNNKVKEIAEAKEKEIMTV